ncbi:pentatricopeptide repeat-containing protein [Hibiscus syriacus]|uniref:Pentatricopeptide repeat-containing protein n=1 Tax=Hibiscus syriacus TaxID=106335 RepID=A0A6A3AY74_HIBSY|nr:pentatricopeptide repeat-containing protein [Hibiscus syriacus]
METHEWGEFFGEKREKLMVILESRRIANPFLSSSSRMKRNKNRNSVRHPISRPLPLPLPRRPDADQKPVPRKPNKPPRHQPKYHLPRSEIKQILKAHNEARAHESEPLYVWDESLALYARQWADKRINDCRIVHSNGPYGENIFLAAKDHWSIPKAVKSWVNEEKYYDKESNVCQPGKMCGHYTQIVWRDTMKVGCARVKCEMGGVFIMCSYDPPGNYQDENPFASHEQ